MPYIAEEKRASLDPIVDDLLNVLRGLACDDPDTDNLEGNLNYFISSVLDRLYTNGRYTDIKDAVGLLESIKLEYYRKVGAPVEDQKEFDNGQVYGR